MLQVSNFANCLCSSLSPKTMVKMQPVPTHKKTNTYTFSNFGLKIHFCFVAIFVGQFLPKKQFKKDFKVISAHKYFYRSSNEDLYQVIPGPRSEPKIFLVFFSLNIVLDFLGIVSPPPKRLICITLSQALNQLLAASLARN